jgi:hypothetical protein
MEYNEIETPDADDEIELVPLYKKLYQHVLDYITIIIIWSSFLITLFFIYKIITS